MRISHKVKFLCVGLALTLSLNSCGSARSGQATNENCVKLLSNLQAMNKSLHFGDLDRDVDTEYVVLVSGQSSRNQFQDLILKRFPFLNDIQPKSKDARTTDVNLTKVTYDSWTQAVAGTGFNSKLSSADLSRVLQDDSGVYPKVITPLVERATGPEIPDKKNPASGCGKVAPDISDKIHTNWSQVQDMTWNFAQDILAIRTCEQFGNFEGKKCANSDYVMPKEDFSDKARCSKKNLSITETSGEPGVSCGMLSFSIFQADLNTGACQALGNWTDANGVSRVAIFAGCGFVENNSYRLPVILGNNVTYTTRLGSQNTVVSFSLAN